MRSNYSPSINIVRDSSKELDYIVTANAERIAERIVSDFESGFHSFNIIGSYGTGKSLFLWAFEQSLANKKPFFNLSRSKYSNVKSINIVGDYTSLSTSFNELLGVEDDFVSNQKLFDNLFQEYVSIGDNGLLIIAIDEFGKFLEYASKNNPEKEMYFIQQLAEFVNDPTRNILLLTTLHQGIDSYANSLNASQRNEWRKVRGRLQEIPFNEPIEQLLTLASNYFEDVLGVQREDDYSKKLINLQKSNHILAADWQYFRDLKNKLYPLDVFSAFTLTSALQRYGQNERSLFSFIQSSDSLGIQSYVTDKKYYSISSVYDYLLSNYYSTLTSKSNPDFSNWNAIKDTLQRIENIEDINVEIADDLIKTIGLLQIFSSKGASINDDFLSEYLSQKHTPKAIIGTLVLLTKSKLLRFVKFNNSYKLFEGTDLDIEAALVRAENQVEEVTDIVSKLEQYFDFPVLTAKEISYTTGTPRLFEYRLSSKPIIETPEGEIDGFVNLVFSSSLNTSKIKDISKETNEPIVYVFFNNTERISGALFDIDKTDQVLKSIEDDGDRVAIKELQSIKRSNINLLNHYVIDALFNNKEVDWIYNGKSIEIIGKKHLNQLLSKVCKDIYTETPVLRNELFNKHKVSGAIASARKNYFEALVNSYSSEDLGFSTEKFPPEKTIYFSLLKETGIHRKSASGYELVAPTQNSSIYAIWEVCVNFLSSAKDEKKYLTELIDQLSKAPYKIKQGVIEFWVPTFLFMRRGDYALYSEGVFKPYINETELYLITRNPQHYEIKSFELNDLRLSFFNQYRRLLQQQDSTNLTVNSFIESIRPILLLYRGFNDYQKTTKRISSEAIAFRGVIENAKDPENLFFDQFPKALGFDVNELLKSENQFDDYIFKFQSAINELKGAYDELLIRFEKFIVSEIIGRNCDFETYKNELSKRFKGLKEHQLLPKQKTFIQRLNSPLNDRESWLASIGQTIIGKPLTSIEDKDELILMARLKSWILELDNLTSIDRLAVDSDKEEVFKLDITTKSKGLIPRMVRIPKNKIEESKALIESIQKDLGGDKKTRIAILAKLLKDELENE